MHMANALVGFSFLNLEVTHIPSTIILLSKLGHMLVMNCKKYGQVGEIQLGIRSSVMLLKYHFKKGNKPKIFS